MSAPKTLRTLVLPFAGRSRAMAGPWVGVRRWLSSSKHPAGFTPPSRVELEELRERVQEFTRREITEEVAARADRSSEFPTGMWRKLGEAGLLGVTVEAEVGGLAM